MSPHQLLGVGLGASQDEIRRAYRKLAAKLHPDRNPGDSAAEARFKEISKAYEILSGREAAPRRAAAAPAARAPQWVTQSRTAAGQAVPTVKVYMRAGSVYMVGAEAFMSGKPVKVVLGVNLGPIKISVNFKTGQPFFQG